MCAERLMQGCPPSDEFAVNLENWRDAPYNRWAFSHMRELVPTQSIPRGEATRTLPVRNHASGLEDLVVGSKDSDHATLGDVLAETYTDAVVVLHEGEIVLERCTRWTREDTLHLLMSVSKPVVGCIAGILVEQGHLDPNRRTNDYVPEVHGSGYDGARVRDLLDMRTGVKFSEDYTDRQSDLRRMERHMGWRRGRDDLGEGTYAYLLRLESQRAHGGAFQYRSSDADMLGWICERAGDARMSALISSLLWAPMGAEYSANITCDAVGTAVHDGGISAASRDLARFGQLLLDGGAWEGRQIVPGSWLRQLRGVDQDIRDAFAASEHEAVLPGGWYRNQFWMVPTPSGIVQLGLGIHGQMLMVDPCTRTVAVKFSTWPDPQNATYLLDTVRAFGAAGRHLAGSSSP